MTTIIKARVVNMGSIAEEVKELEVKCQKLEEQLSDLVKAIQVDSGMCDFCINQYTSNRDEPCNKCHEIDGSWEHFELADIDS